MANDINWKHWQKKDGSLRTNAPAHVVAAHKDSLAMWENAATTPLKSELSSAYRSGRTFDQSGNLIDKVAGEPQAAARPNFTRPGISSDLPNVPAVRTPTTAVVPVSPAVSHAQAPQGPSIKDAYVGSGSAARSGITDAERATLRSNLEKRIPTSPWKMPIGEGAKQLASKAAPIASKGLRGAGLVGGLMSANEALKADNWGDRVYHGVNALAGGLTAFGPTMGAGVGLGLANNAIRAFAGGGGPSEANGTVDPKEVQDLIDKRQAATPSQAPVTEALPDRSLGQLIAGRANNMDRLQGEVLRAKDTLSDAQAETAALAPLGGRASAVDAIINPMRMAAHTRDERAGLQRAMGEYGMAQKAQGHDDKMGLDLQTLNANQSLARAKMAMDINKDNYERFEKNAPQNFMTNEKGEVVPDSAANAESKTRMLQTSPFAASGFDGQGQVITPAAQAQQLGLDQVRDQVTTRMNEVAGPTRKVKGVYAQTADVGPTRLSRALMPGGESVGQWARGSFGLAPDEVIRNQAGQHMLAVDAAGGDKSLAQALRRGGPNR